MNKKSVSTSGKSKGQIIALFSLLGIFLAGAGYLTYKAFAGIKKNPSPSGGGGTKSPPPVSGSGGNGGSASSYTPPVSGSGGGGGSVFPLKMGSNNASVRTLQSALDGYGANLVIDGIFGSLTQTALINQTGKSTVDSQSELDSLVNNQPAWQAPADATVTPTTSDISDVFNLGLS